MFYRGLWVLLFAVILSSCGLPTKEDLNKAYTSKDVKELKKAKTLYQEAMVKQDIEELRKLENAGYQKYVADYRGDTAFPIHYAILNNKPKVLDFAIQQGYDINALSYGMTPLMLAVKANDFTLVQNLVNLKVDVNKQNAGGSVALSFVQDPGTQIAEFLLKSGGNPILVKSDEKRYELLKEQKNNFAFINEKSEELEKLFTYIREGNSEKALVVINSGMSLDIVSDKKSPPLYLASGYGLTDVVKGLIAKGVDVNQKHQGVTALYNAVVFKHLDVVNELLKAGANPNLATNGGWTPLMIAVDENNEPMVKALLKAGANPNLAEIDGWTPLLLTMNNGDNVKRDYGHLAKLLIANGADVDQVKKDGYTPLNLAVAFNKPKVFAELLKAKANPNLASNDGWTPLMRAVNENNEPMVKALLKAGANPNLAENNGWTPLFLTMNNTGKVPDNGHLAKLLIANGAGVDQVRKDGYTPLNLAAALNKPKVFAELLKAKANPNIASNNGLTPLLHAVVKNNEPMIKVLLKAGADVNQAQKGGYGMTPLGKAVWLNRPMALVELLLKAKANPNIGGNDGYTPLMSAVNENNEPMVKALLKAGANPNAADNDGRTPLFLTMNNTGKVPDNGHLAKLLIANGADVDQVKKNGYTPLNHAVSWNKPKVFAELLKAKANPNLAGNDGLTPLRNAVDENNEPMFKALLKAGANPNLAKNDAWTPLMKAVDENNEPMVKALLKAGANPNAADSTGWTPLFLTMNNIGKVPDNGHLAKLLIANGADINKEKNGLSPISFASVYNKPNVAKYLIGARANLERKNKDGDTPIMSAAYFGHYDIVKMLIKAGADTGAVNWEDKQRSALDYAILKKHYDIADMLRRNNAISGLEQSKYPAAPAPRNGYVTCNTRCNNGDCYRTYSDGRKVHFQAERKYNSFSGQFEWDSGGC